MENQGVYFITEDGDTFGTADKSRLKVLPWYKRIWARLNRKYRNKHIDVKPFRCK